MASNSTRRVALASIFGVLILSVMGFVPAPTSDYLIVVQSLLLALSFLVVGRGGATFVGVVSGLLITLVKVAFFPYDLAFSLLFGISVDVLGALFKARVAHGGRAATGRLVVVMMISTGIVGFVAYYLTAVATNLVPNDLVLDLTVLVFGVVSGAAGGYLAARIWNRNLRVRLSGEAAEGERGEGPRQVVPEHI